MRIPQTVTGRTRPSGQGMGYLQAADASQGGMAVAQGLQLLGAGLEGYKERQDKFKRFETLSDYTEFETLVSEQLSVMKRDAEVDIANFPGIAEAEFDKQQSRFLNRLPPDLQDEFKYRTDLLKQRIVVDALGFQYASQDAFFTQKIGEQFDKARSRLAGADDPNGVLVEEEKKLAEMLTTAALPQSEKARLAREYNIGLQSIIYQREYTRGKLGEGNVSDSPTVDKLVAKIVDVESGGNRFAKNPRSSATGPGGFIKSTWLDIMKRHYPGIVDRMSDAEILDLRTNDNLSRQVTGIYVQENAARLAGAGVQPTEGALYLAHFAGPAGAIAVMKANPQASIESVLGSEVVAANPHLKGKTAGWTVNWAARKMGGPAPNLDEDERFASIPYDTKIALREDADTAVTKMIAERERIRKEDYDKRYNELLNGLMDGTRGKQELVEAYNGGRGWLTDYTDRDKAETVLKKYQEESQDLFKAANALNDPSHLWVDNEEHRKWQNLLFKQRGPDALAAMDINYGSTLVAMADRTRDLPTEAIATLEALTRSKDNKQAWFGYNMLSLLQDNAPEAYDKRVSDKLAADVAYWRNRKDHIPEEDLMLGLRKGTTQQERQARTMLYSEAEAILAGKRSGVPDAKELAAEFIDEYNPVFGRAAGVYNLPWAAGGIQQDFSEIFKDEYVRYGDADLARDATIQIMKRQYGVTEIGGRKTLMKRPPEQVYRPVNGSYDYITEEVRTKIGDKNFQLISDEQTENELMRYAAGQGNPPSYLVSVETERGWSIPMEEGEMLRMWFEPSEELLKEEEGAVWQGNFDNAIQALQDEYRERLAEPQPWPPVDSDERRRALTEEFRAREEKLRKSFEARKPN